MQASMANLAQNETQLDQGIVRPQNSASHRRRPLRVLFIHRDTRTVECCLQELKKGQFTVSSDSVLSIAQCTEQLRTQSCDVVVAEYTSPNWDGWQALQLLHQTLQEIPLIFVTTAIGSESILQPTDDCAFACIDREHLAQLPMTVRRAETAVGLSIPRHGTAGTNLLWFCQRHALAPPHWSHGGLAIFLRRVARSQYLPSA